MLLSKEISSDSLKNKITYKLLTYNSCIIIVSVRGVVVVGNGHGDTSSNPGPSRLHFHVPLIPLEKV